MLPFLGKKNDKGMSSGLIVKTRTPDAQPDTDQDDPSAAIKACSRALIDAVHARDEQGVSDALSDAFEILESQEHEEGPHVEPHSYDASQED